MLITNHVLAGALIGRASPDPLTAAALGLASHFAMDALPHWGVDDHDTYLRVARVDGVTGLLASAAVLLAAPREDRWRIAAGIFGACLPDTDQVAVHFLGRHIHPAPVNDFHYAIQYEHGWFPQELLVAGGLAWAVGRRWSRTAAARQP